jgi:DNA-binding NtrC family response regulator
MSTGDETNQRSAMSMPDAASYEPARVPPQSNGTTHVARPGNGNGGQGTIVVVGSASAELRDLGRALESIAPTVVTDGAGARTLLVRHDAHVIVADDRVGQLSGREFLEQVGGLRPSALRILLSAETVAPAPANGIGAVVVVSKPVDRQALRTVCGVALRCAEAQRAVRRLQGENERLRRTDTEPAACSENELADIERYEGLLARSALMRRTLRMLRKVEGSDTPVVIYGERGTGKELVARAIHARSRRAGGPFVPAKLSAVAESLRESLLFGHVRGAFPGAVQNRNGLFVEADGGVVFIDEVSEASPGLQVALLRALEEGAITPVGSDRPRQVDVRILAGTTRNLAELVRTGVFRQDLYYRLSVFPVELSPLRERPEDIFPLAKDFLAAAAEAHGKKPPAVSREARAVLEAHTWEGNVRELRNVMERAAILSKGQLLVVADLPLAPGAAAQAEGGPGATITIPPAGATLQELEHEIFVKTLALTNGNQTRAARILGLRESTLRFRLRKLGIASRRVGGAPSQPAANGRSKAVSR